MGTVRLQCRPHKSSSLAGSRKESSLGPLPDSVMGEGATAEEYLSSNTGADPEGAKAGGYRLNILLELGNKP